MSKNKFLRTCLVTGQKLAPEKLIRFTIIDGEIVFDPVGQKNTGRGGYVKNDPNVIAKLPKLRKKVNHFMRSNLA